MDIRIIYAPSYNIGHYRAQKVYDRYLTGF
jgi:hypothetical protein